MRALLLAALCGGAALPAFAQPGVHTGALNVNDETLSSGEYADAYTVTTTAGATLTIDLQSPDFDPYLIAIAPSGEQFENDDWEDHLDWSRLELPDAESGDWRILVTTYEPGETGSYTLEIEREATSTPSSGDAYRAITVCMLDGTDLLDVDAAYDPNTGDTLVDGRLFSEMGYHYADWVYTQGRYAEPQPWYINSDPLTVNGAAYVKFGLPRVLGTTDVGFLTEAGGAAVYAESGSDDTPEIVYVAVRPGCEFQPYQLDR